MSRVTCYALSSNRVRFLEDFVRSFDAYSRLDTKLVVGVQGCTDGTQDWIRQQTFSHKIIFEIFPDNLGLNGYPRLIEKWNDGSQVLVDLDDDVLLVPGYEKAFERVLSDSKFGWVGYVPTDGLVIPINENRTWDVGGIKVVEAACGGGLAATRRATYNELGGFGFGKTPFDPEDARYQRKCIAAGYQTGVMPDFRYEHHSSWEWAIKYGTTLQKMDNLHNALMAGFLSEETYRAMVMDYCSELEKQNG